MGNNRQQLKDSITKGITGQIEQLKMSLNELNLALIEVSEDSIKAKNQVAESVETLLQALMTRKSELNRQIDLITQGQVNSLQERIRSIYMSLGGLQSTLDNLDSIDQAQLLNLQLSNFSMTNLSGSSKLETRLPTGDLEMVLKSWGSVSAKGFKGLTDIGSSPSMPSSFVEYNDLKRDQMFHKTLSPSHDIHFKLTKLPPPLVSTQAMANAVEKSRKTVYSTPKDKSPQEWPTYQWLKEIKSKPCMEDKDEEFELVSVSDGESSRSNSSEAFIMTELSEGIIQVSKEEEGKEELSKWLRPKRKSEEEIKVDNRRVIFPCLSLGPEYWICPKRSRSEVKDQNYTNKASPKGFVLPPNHDMPYTFWLKKKSSS